MQVEGELTTKFLVQMAREWWQSLKSAGNLHVLGMGCMQGYGDDLQEMVSRKAKRCRQTNSNERRPSQVATITLLEVRPQELRVTFPNF